MSSDIRGYSTIAEHAHPYQLAGQPKRHRDEMNRAILDARGTAGEDAGDAGLAGCGGRPRAPAAISVRRIPRRPRQFR